MDEYRTILDRYLYRSDIERLVGKDVDFPDYNLENKVAVYIIRNIYKGKTKEQTISELSKLYSIDSSRIEQDVNNFIHSLIKKDKESEPLKKIREGLPIDGSMYRLNYPLSIEVELTRRCNWNCKFCYNTWKHNSKFDNNIDIKLYDFYKIIDESVDNGCNIVRLSGGEPTAYPYFDNIVKYASNKGCRIALFTNGSRINDEMIRFLKDNNVIKVLLSLHGMKIQHENLTGIIGSFNATLNTIKLLLSYGMDVSVETLVTGQTSIEELYQMANLLYKLGIKNWNLMPFVATGTGEIDTEYKVNIGDYDYAIRDIITKYGINIRVVCSQKLCIDGKADDNYYVDGNCGSGIYWLSISYDGKVRNCPHSNVFAGKIDDGIKYLYLNKIKPKILSIYDRRDKMCNDCNHFLECRGGCHLNKIGKY